MSELVSVIVPVYKAEDYIDRCIDSIVNQTYQKLEIILVDDGSPDRCPELCDQWADKDARIRVIHQNNQGVSAARNTGISCSSGNYIVMVDSDDYLASNMVRLLCEALLHNSADLAVCGYETGTQDTCQFETVECCSCELITGIQALERIYIDNHHALQYVSPWAKLYKRELFEGIQYPKGKIFEDIYVTHQILLKCNRVAVVPCKLVYYFQHPDSIMHAPFHTGKLDYLEALKERIDFFHVNCLPELESIAYDEYLHALIWEYSRARDILGNREAMKDIANRFHAAYRKGYASKRYPKETTQFLSAFNTNPEWIIAYWKLKGKWNSLCSKG